MTPNQKRTIILRFKLKALQFQCERIGRICDNN